MEKYKGEIISLFGEKLLLHERSIKDAMDLNEFIKGRASFDPATEIYINTLILLNALRFNIERLLYFKFRGKRIPLRLFKYKRLRKKLSINYIYKNLGIGTLKQLVDKVRFDFEKQPRSNQKTEEISRSNMIQLVAKYSNMKWGEVEELSVSEFTIRLEQAFNMLNTEISGRFGIKSRADEEKETLDAYNHFFGSVN